MTSPLPADLRLGAVHVVVADVDRSVAWYQRALGLHVHLHEAGLAEVGDGTETVVVLHEDARARPAGRHAGLYHYALLYPSRAELARAAMRLAATRTPIEGASDHRTHEAIYLPDPDGNGIELAADRPRERWPAGLGYDGGPAPLDFDARLAAAMGEPPSEHVRAGLRVGHVHLHVGDIDEALAFYRDVLGFELQANLGTAAFVSAGGYHHHLGVNVWRGRGVGPAPAHNRRPAPLDGAARRRVRGPRAGPVGGHRRRGRRRRLHRPRPVVDGGQLRQHPRFEREDTMNITIIGTGNMARGIATRALAGGHAVTLLGTSADKSEALAGELSGDVRAGAVGDGLESDVVVLAVWYQALDDVLRRYGDQLEGRIVVDITNPVDPQTFQPLNPEAGSAAQEIARRAPGARVVKAFNTTFAGTLVQGEVGGQSLDVFVASDDEDAKRVLGRLAEDGGLRVIDAGPLATARQLEGAGYVHMAIQGGLGTGYGSALKVVA
jgi:catechol 2,3-dioxygenase